MVSSTSVKKSLYLNTSVHSNGHAHVIEHLSEGHYSSRECTNLTQSNVITIKFTSGKLKRKLSAPARHKNNQCEKLTSWS